MIIISLSGIQVQTKADNVADSLLILVTKAKEDTNKVKLLIRLCDVYLLTEKDQALKYCKSLLALSEKSSMIAEICFLKLFTGESA